MKRVFFFFLAFCLTVMPAFCFSEIDDVASIEAQTKGEYKKIDKDFFLKGVSVFENLVFSDEEKALAELIYEKYINEYYLEALF